MKKQAAAVHRAFEPRVPPKPEPSWYPYAHLGAGGLVFSGDLHLNVAGTVVDTLIITFGPLWRPDWAVVDVAPPWVLGDYLQNTLRPSKAPEKPLAVVLVPGFDERFKRKAGRLGVAVIEVSAR